MEVNPFEAPPLVEFENCITIQELSTIFNNLSDHYQSLRWYNWTGKRNIAVMKYMTYLLYKWILAGKPLMANQEVKK